MGAGTHLSREDRLGLGIAIAAHVAVVAVLVLRDDSAPPIAMPERMVVSLANDVSLKSTAPEPAAEAAASYAPEIAQTPAPPEPEPVPTQAPPKVEPAPVPPPPRAKATTAPQPKPSPAPKPSPKASAKPSPAPSPTRQKAGGSRIGADFLKGESDSEGRSGTPAETFGPAQAAALNSAISRQLKPHWSAPSGADADKLVTIVRFRLNSDGSLAGAPNCVSQSGVTPSNAPQKQLHCDRAIRAVRLAAPFDLPDQFYDKWKLVDSRFDRRL